MITINTHEIMAVTLSAPNVTDAEVLSNLLTQTHRRINVTSDDGADDTRQCYETIRIKRAIPLILPRRGIIFG
ncbi:hypothetical protein [Candidatus Enterovibrio altilux]